MNIAIIGGGINGLCIAWQAVQQGHTVSLFERGQLMSETSSKSSKLLHGGLRYLENGEFRLVREALKERHFWLQQNPELTRPLRFYLPVYQHSRRPAWMIRLGLYLYDLFAGHYVLEKHRKENIEQFKQRHPEFKQTQLKAVYSYSDGQMDDKQLGLWLAHKLKAAGVKIYEHTPVQRVYTTGKIQLSTEEYRIFNKVINVAGPWAEQLLQQSDIPSKTHLDLVRGSHIVIDRPLSKAFILEVPNERRVFFVLPHHGKTLVGTTEVRQSLHDPIVISAEEQAYLLNAYQYYFNEPVTEAQIIDRYAGLRPLLRSHANPNKVSREYVIEAQQQLISVFGGKWTTSRALGEELVTHYL